MTDLLTIGATATQLYRQALSTVSNNIANINSDGYSRQEVTTAENAPTTAGRELSGYGLRDSLACSARMTNLRRAVFAPLKVR